MSSIDYSKWDTLSCSSSSSSSSPPPYTVLPTPSSVTFGGNSSGEIKISSPSEDPESSAAASVKEKLNKYDDVASDGKVEKVKRAGANAEASSATNFETSAASGERSKKNEFPPSTKNGSNFKYSLQRQAATATVPLASAPPPSGAAADVYWTQTRYDVTISVDLSNFSSSSSSSSLKFSSSSPKVGHVKVINPRDYKDRNSAIGGDGCGIEIMIGFDGEEEEEGGFFVKEQLLHDVHLGEEDDGGEFMGDELQADWEVVNYSVDNDDDDNSRRCLEVTLQKCAPMDGVVVWWSRLFKESKFSKEEDVDVGGIRGKGGEEVRESWRKAEEMFRERVRNKGLR